MQSGKLRHLLTLEQATETNTAGEVTRTWSRECDLRAEFVKQDSREFVRAREIQNEVTHLLQLRWSSVVTAQKRFLFDGRVLNIIGVENVNERNREMMVRCKESV